MPAMKLLNVINLATKFIFTEPSIDRKLTNLTFNVQKF